ncbi:PIN domain-containing protein [Thermococcus sp. M36]|uniref:PIN domain-containing protein n=1 Tax=Thermococcus sp. M36 TaxID=1638261 RepID=UPI00143A4881|nr:PIN domain-containing protein [Thermococcus sp. M36]NJE05728.1 PIN domain-containing protein [Thermococcus sp. M36]
MGSNHAQRNNWYYVDTSFLISLCDPKDQYHERSREFLNNPVSSHNVVFFIGWPTLWETTNELIKKHGKRVAKTFFERILELGLKFPKNFVLLLNPLQVEALISRKDDLKDKREIFNFLENKTDPDYLIALSVSLFEFEFLATKIETKRSITQKYGNSGRNIVFSNEFDLFDAWVTYFMIKMGIDKILTFDTDFRDRLGFEIYPLKDLQSKKTKVRRGTITEENINNGLSFLQNFLENSTALL